MPSEKYQPITKELLYMKRVMCNSLVIEGNKLKEHG
jgi:hypothetical protein